MCTLWKGYVYIQKLTLIMFTVDLIQLMFLWIICFTNVISFRLHNPVYDIYWTLICTLRNTARVLHVEQKPLLYFESTHGLGRVSVVQLYFFCSLTLIIVCICFTFLAICFLFVSIFNVWSCLAILCLWFYSLTIQNVANVYCHNFYKKTNWISLLFISLCIPGILDLNQYT